MKNNYKKYINSNEWKEKRQELIDKIGYECQQCGWNHNLQVHHKTYENFGNESIDDLQLLCYTCHMSKHDNYFKKYIQKSKPKKRKKSKLSFSKKIKMLENPKGRRKLRKIGYKF